MVKVKCNRAQYFVFNLKLRFLTDCSLATVSLVTFY